MLERRLIVIRIKPVNQRNRKNTFVGAMETNPAARRRTAKLAGQSHGKLDGASQGGRMSVKKSTLPKHRGVLSAGVAIERPIMKRAFDIPSDFAASRDAQLAIMSDVQAAGFAEEDVFAIRISLEEAIVNAIRHGNRLDSSKRVRIESTTSPLHVEIMVEDDGVGFDRKHVPDPTSVENLCRPSGRGILLIESYMTEVRWEKGGRRMHMIKHIVPVASRAKAK